MEEGKIFISYRREDTSGESGRLKDKLEQVFGKENIFYDVETLEAGLNFDQSIAKALNESTVLLAMIGPHWLKTADSKGEKRLLKANDWVRKEIAEALKREIRVIPVLVNGAEMPDPDELPEDLKDLTFRHAQELSSSRWNYDVGVLSNILEKIILKKPELQPEPTPNSRTHKTQSQPLKNRFSKKRLWAIGALVVFSLISMALVFEYLSKEYVPETNISWILEEKRSNSIFSTTIVFENKEDMLHFYIYDSDTTISGEGSVQVNKKRLDLMFTWSSYDSTGKILMKTMDSGKTWEGESSYPQFNETYNARLYKKTNP